MNPQAMIILLVLVALASLGTLTGIFMHSNKYKEFPAVVPSPGVAAGDMGLVEDTVGVWFKAGDTGDTVTFVYQCDSISLPKNVVSTDVFAVGDILYYDASTKKVTATSGSNKKCGRCKEAAAAAATVVVAELNGAVNA